MSKNLIISLVVLVCLVVLYVFWEEGSEKGITKWKVYTKNIDKISITFKGTNTFLKKTKEGNWLIGENEYEGSKEKVNLFLAMLTNERVFELISDSPYYPKFGLSTEEKIDLEGFEGVTSVKKLIIGKASTSFSHTFVLLKDQGPVYQANGNFRTEAETTPADMRDKLISSFSRLDLVSLEITEGSKNLIITRHVQAPVIEPGTSNVASKTEEYWKDQNGNKLSENKVSDIINILGTLNAESFNEKLNTSLTEKNARKFDIKTTKESIQVYLSSVGEETKEATSSNRKTGFNIAKSTAETLLVSFTSLKE